MTATSSTKFQKDLGLLGRFLLGLANSSTVAGNAIITAENVASAIDPALVPEIIAAQAAMLIIGEALELLAEGHAANQNYWLGAPRAI